MLLLPESSKRYSAIMIDPPWQFKVWSNETGIARSADNHYPTLDIKELKKLPIQRLMGEDCAVFMWAIWSMLPEALELGKAWGLTYKTLGFDWLKRTSTGQKWHMGMGYWSRANSEPCLLFTKGNPKRKSKEVRQLLVEDDSQLPLFPPMVNRVLSHSAKPTESYCRVEQLVDGPYLDVFARRKTKGWDAIGNEIDGRDIRDVLSGWQRNPLLKIS